jgi:hypothetical protein
MTFKRTSIVFALLIAAPSLALAQGTIPGAERGIRDGDRAAGPIGGVVGGAVGAATGTVGGVLGVPADEGCATSTTRRSDSYGNSETTRRSNCP